jgi:CheY-like chemotaxis protein
MSMKTVLVLEDRPVLRTTVGDGLRSRGFNVIVAGSADEAWKLTRNVDDIDVALLDIHLDEGPIETGLDFGMKLKRARSAWPPEFLIYSAYDNPDYYQTAITLGAAAYLRKGIYGGDATDPGTKHPPRVEVLAQHVRALALRRALHSERPRMHERLKQIAEASRTRDEVFEGFCRHILAEELAAIFGRSFVLLLTHEHRTLGYFGDHRPVSNRVLNHIQEAAHSRLGDMNPLVIDTAESDWLRDVPAEESDAALAILRLINGAAFTVLGDGSTLRLSLGVLPAEPWGSKTSDQVRILDRYLQPPVIRHLLELTDTWSKLQLERQRNQVLLRATGDFCFYQGQELSTLLFDVEKGGTEGPAFRKARVIAEEMRDAGELLTYFPGHDDSNGFKPEPVDMRNLIDRVWTGELAQRLRITDEGFLRVEGDCVASEYPIRAERAVLQILGWMGRRLARLQPEETNGLFVQCTAPSGSARVKIIFEEVSSRRVPIQLRETFFKPFYQSGVSDLPDDIPDKGRRLGLYLARALADLAGGTLVDSSDSIEGIRGHRFELELPAAHVA